MKTKIDYETYRIAKQAELESLRTELHKLSFNVQTLIRTDLDKFFPLMNLDEISIILDDAEVFSKYLELLAKNQREYFEVFMDPEAFEYYITDNGVKAKRIKLTYFEW